MSAAPMPVLYVRPFTLRGRLFDRVEPLSLYAIRTYRPVSVLNELQGRTEPKDSDFELISAVVHEAISSSNGGETYKEITLEWVERGLNLGNFAAVLTCILQGSGFEKREQGEEEDGAPGEVSGSAGGTT